MLAGVGHASRLEPAVEDFLHSPQSALALLARNGDVVNLVPVEVRDLSLVSTELLELLNAANANLFLEVVTHPEGDRCTPIPVSRDVPVAGVGNPAGKSLLFDERRYPMGSLDVAQHLGDDLGDADEPRRDGLVNKRGVRAIAHGIRVPQLGIDDKASGTLQILDDVLVGLLHMHTGKVGDFGGEMARVVDRVRRRALLRDNAILDGNVVVVLAESGGLVDDTGTILSGNVGRVQDLEGDVLVIFVEVLEWWLVLPAFHVLALDLLKNLELGLLYILV